MRFIAGSHLESDLRPHAPGAACMASACARLTDTGFTGIAQSLRIAVLFILQLLSVGEENRASAGEMH